MYTGLQQCPTIFGGMKMKKIFVLLLATALCIGCLIGCSLFEEPESYVTSTIISNSTSDYVIVHGGTPEQIEFANDIKDAIRRTYGVTLSVTSASEKKEGGHEIVVGNCRKSVEKLDKNLRSDLDFGMKVTQNQLLLHAKDALSYQYMLEYLKREVFVNNANKELILTSDNNIVYSTSKLMEMNYIDYWMEENFGFLFDKVFSKEVFNYEKTVLPYRIYVPFNYSPDKSYPLIVNLHGAGLRGNDNERQFALLDTMFNDPSMQLDEAIIIMPQCPSGQQWVDTAWVRGSYSINKVAESNELRAVVELVRQLQKTYPVDSSRIYALGFSMGGYGTWDLLMRHPDLFCAGVPMCGAGDPTQAQMLAQIPIWAVHCEKDPTVPVSGSRDMVAAIEAAGGNKLHYTELKTEMADHDAWTYTYSNHEIFTWLLSQKKG